MVNILFHSTYDKLQSRFRKIVITDHLDFLHGESEALLKEERHNDMHNLYLLLREVKDGFASLPDTFRETIKQQGIKVLKSLKKNQVCIKLLFLSMIYNNISYIYIYLYLNI